MNSYIGSPVEYYGISKKFISHEFVKFCFALPFLFIEAAATTTFINHNSSITNTVFQKRLLPININRLTRVQLV